jgi:Fe2+ or Zn2+ uptake regulation protein
MPTPVVATVVVAPATNAPRLASLPEPPHTHLVCRGCARILELPMEFDDQQTLETLLLRAPPGWMVDSITVSITGACARCRQGPAA